MPYFVGDTQHWRERADEARAIAEKLDDLHAKRNMLQIAESYERMAKRAEERSAAKAPGPSS